MTGKNPEPVDLFGNPWVEPKDTRGRKRHKRQSEIAEKIGVLKAAGTSTEDIALFVGLSEPTLRKYYLRELTQGPALARAGVVMAVYQEAKKGRVGAARYMREEFDKGKIERIAKPDAQVKEPAKGKKELRQEAAEAAASMGGRLATPEPPRMQ